MTQYDFDKLLEKYLDGACSPEEELLLDEWANKQMITETVVLPEPEKKIVKKQLWNRIKQSTSPSSYPRRVFGVKNLSIRWLSWAKLGIAASLVFIFSLMWYNSVFQLKNSKGKLTGVEMTNPTEKPELITLNDGTTVILQPNSSITFPEKFGDYNRIVYLKGEGFFKVKRDTTKPFYVYAGNLITEVLGTSFTVKSYETDKISEVIVVSGKVMVYNNPNSMVVSKGEKKEVKPVFLTPNQKVVFEKKTQQIKLEVVEKPIIVNPPITHERFSFQETPLFEVLNRIEEVFLRVI
jgi:transmembrane sensor